MDAYDATLKQRESWAKCSEEQPAKSTQCLKWCEMTSSTGCIQHNRERMLNKHFLFRAQGSAYRAPSRWRLRVPGRVPVVINIGSYCSSPSLVVHTSMQNELPTRYQPRGVLLQVVPLQNQSDMSHQRRKSKSHIRTPNGWLSKLGSLFGYPKYHVPYYNKDPKRDPNFDNHPNEPAPSSFGAPPCRLSSPWFPDIGDPNIVP